MPAPVYSTPRSAKARLRVAREVKNSLGNTRTNTAPEAHEVLRAIQALALLAQLATDKEWQLLLVSRSEHRVLTHSEALDQADGAYRQVA